MSNPSSVDGAQQVSASSQVAPPVAKFSAFNKFGSNGLPVSNTSSVDGAQQVSASSQVAPPVAKFSAFNKFGSGSLIELCAWHAS